MLKFIKDSIRELKHVVWPTRKETQKYFGFVLAILVVFGIYLFIFSNIFSKAIFFLKDSINPTTISESIDIDPNQIFINTNTGSNQSDELLFEDESSPDSNTGSEVDGIDIIESNQETEAQQ